MIILEDFQLKLKDETRAELAKGHNFIFVQSPTRSGKTVIFCDMISDFLKKEQGDCLILVADEKILIQIRHTLILEYGIGSTEITSKVKHLHKSDIFEGMYRVFIAMVETINNRLELQSFNDELSKVKFIITDEGHFANFFKVYEHPLLKSIRRVAFSATPISANKEKQLYPRYFQSIVVGPSIKELIELNKIKPNRGVVKDITFVVDLLGDKSKLKVNDDGEFDQDNIAEKLKGRQVKQVVNAVIRKCFGKRLVVFCANKTHSKDVCKAFNDANIPARHVDSDTNEDLEKATLKWFKNTPGAIMTNVRKFAVGWDCKECEGVVLATLYKSISLVTQIRARGATPWYMPNGEYKKYHYILDCCNNLELHGEFSDPVDWKKIFYSPKYYVPGVAPKKECKKCEAINAASARICCICGEEFNYSSIKEDTIEREMRLVSKDIDVAETIELFKDRREYSSLYDLIRQTAFKAKKYSTKEIIEKEDFDILWLQFLELAKEWKKLLQKKSLDASYNTLMSQLKEELIKHGFKVNYDFSNALFARNIK